MNPLKNIKKKLNFKWIAILSSSCFLLDQISKYLVVKFLENPVNIFSFFRLSYEQNYGMAWSIPLPYPLLLGLNISLLLLLPFFFLKILNVDLILNQILIGILMGGALGNVVDRIFRGYVVDFIAIGSFPVFNLSDTFITLSIFIILVFYDKIARKN